MVKYLGRCLVCGRPMKAGTPYYLFSARKVDARGYSTHSLRPCNECGRAFFSLFKPPEIPIESSSKLPKALSQLP